MYSLCPFKVSGIVGVGPRVLGNPHPHEDTPNSPITKHSIFTKHYNFTQTHVVCSNWENVLVAVVVWVP